MAELLADIKLRWFDESNLLLNGQRELLEAFMDSIGVTSEVAVDLMHVLLLARAKDVAISTAQVKEGIVRVRKQRRAKRPSFGLTDRNIQIWLRYFENIGLLDSIGGKHRFASNKRPTDVFQRTREVVLESLSYSERLLGKVEEEYGI